MTAALHDNELPIDLSLVRRLIDDQLPQHAHLSLQPLSSSGSSNLLFRLGDDLLVRLPRQPGGSGGLHIEQQWAARLNGLLPVAIPRLLMIGEPVPEYPESWSVLGWLDGSTVGSAASNTLSTEQRTSLAADLAEAVLALRAVEVSPEAARTPALRHYRGNTLRSFDTVMRKNIDACRNLAGLDLDLDHALSLWEQALTLPGADARGPHRWYHSDLVAENLLCLNGRLNAILDFGGLGVGDPTIDLHGAWELFNGSDREIFRQQLGVDEAQWLRGRAWAVAIALGCFSYYWDKMPTRINDRLIMAKAALADDFG
jgi:aminoglycoside phosphotransferase (APT) family kinase protein